MDIILASQSPRRRELLGLLGLNGITVLPAENEEAPDLRLSPGQALEQVALSKALDVQRRLPPEKRADSLLIGADTMVFLNEELLGKPRTLQEAREMLHHLSGRTHTVYTGLALVRGEQQLCRFEQTDVHFRPLTAQEISAYVRREPVLDKAGAYAIQGLAASFVSWIRGDYSNVVGLPLCRLTLMLREMGYDIFS